jgi:hypothetical protein
MPLQAPTQPSFPWRFYWNPVEKENIKRQNCNNVMKAHSFTNAEKINQTFKNT